MQCERLVIHEEFFLTTWLIVTGPYMELTSLSRILELMVQYRSSCISFLLQVIGAARGKVPSQGGVGATVFFSEKRTCPQAMSVDDQ